MASFQTLRFDGVLDEATKTLLERASRGAGASLRACASHRFERSYATIESESPVDADVLLRDIPAATLYDGAIIAIAIEPTPTDALPLLAEALGGAGRPSGVRTAERVGDALVVEFLAQRSPARFVLDIVDVELRRFHGYRRVELLTPAPAEWLARAAAEGLGAPEIDTSRILEALLERDV